MIIRAWSKHDYLNYVDMNRIESNILECYQLVFENSDITVKTDRTYSSVDTVTDFNRIEGYIKEMADTLEKSYGITPKTNWVTNDRLSYQDMNRIENNISYIYQIYTNYTKVAPYVKNYTYPGYYNL